MGDVSYEDRILAKKSLDDKSKLRKIALKINKIPYKFSKRGGSLDLDKIHLALMDYQK
jgi:hypothetical protein